MKSLWISILLCLYANASSAAPGYYPWGWRGWLQAVATITNAPTGGVAPGSIEFALDTDALYYWSGSAWVEITGGGGGSGTVTDVSVVTANGLAGTVANSTTTPAITLSTTITGVLLGDGTAISSAASSDIIGLFSGCSGTDYLGADGACHAVGGGTPGGANTDVQYNSSGSFAGDSGFTYAGSGNATLTGKISSASANISGLTASEPVVSDSSKNLISGSVSSPLTFTSNAFGCQTASISQSGCLSSSDFTTFNGKQASGSYITALTGDITASGPGSSTATLATVNSDVGSFINANITVNAKGLITAAANGSGGGGSPGGSDTDIQFNNSGSFGGNADLTYDGISLNAANILNAGGGITTTLIETSTGATLAIDVNNLNLRDLGGTHTVNWNTDHLTDSSNDLSIDWNARDLVDTAAATQLSWSTSGVNVPSLTASKPVFSDASKNLTSTGVVPEVNGGTNQSSYSTGDTLYASASNTLSKLPGNTTTGIQVLTSQGTGSAGQAPVWQQISAIGISVDFTSCDTLTIGAVTTPPTKGGSTVDQCRYARVGDHMIFQYTYVQTSGGSSGSGQYLFPIPASLSADTSKITADTTSGTIVANGAVSNATNFTNSDSNLINCYLYDSTHLACRSQHAADAFQLFGSGSDVTLSATNARFSFQAEIPISGWSSNTIGGVGGYMPFSTGALVTLPSNAVVGSGLTSSAQTIKTITAQASVFTCTGNPTLTLFDCGTSSSSCSSGTSIGTATLTGANSIVTGSFTPYALALSHYWAWLVTSGTCTALNATGTAGF